MSKSIIPTLNVDMNVGADQRVLGLLNWPEGLLTDQQEWAAVDRGYHARLWQTLNDIDGDNKQAQFLVPKCKGVAER